MVFRFHHFKEKADLIGLISYHDQKIWFNQAKISVSVILMSKNMIHYTLIDFSCIKHQLLI